jgi:hypothetical protein
VGRAKVKGPYSTLVLHGPDSNWKSDYRFGYLLSTAQFSDFLLQQRMSWGSILWGMGEEGTKMH